MNYAREMLLGNAEPRQDIPCVNCNLYDALRENGNWLSRRELNDAIRDPGILLSIVVEAAPGARVDVFLYRGRFEGRLDSLTRSLPPASFTCGKDYAVYFAVPEPGEYTICAIPARPAPGSRGSYDWKRAAQRTVKIPAVPICQEIEVLVK